MALRMSGLASGMDTESIVSEMMKAQRLKSTKLENKITKLEWKQDKWKTMNSKLYSFYTGALSKVKMQGSFSTKTVSSSNENKASVTANTTAPQGTHSLRIEQLAKSQFVTGDSITTSINSDTKLTDLGFTAGTANKIKIDGAGTAQSLEITETTTVGDFTKALKDAGLNASFDTTQKRFFISSKESGYSNAFSISTEGSVDLSLLGLSDVTDNGDGTVSIGANGKLVAPTDAKIVYNGAELTSSSNTITANGMTFTLKGVTAGFDTPLDSSDDEVINLNVSDNTQAVYDMVKDFVKTYNELMTGMNESYYAVTAKGYDPLTDDEKESMTDDQIVKWEDKIKNSLLRRDNTLNTLISSMRSTLGGNVEIDGKKYSLSTFGIGTTDYTEKGLLHIDGNSDDSTVSSKDNDLMKALTEDPDKVMKVFNKLAGDLYKSMTDDMKSTSLRSALTFYNDKEITKTVTDYKSELATLEDKLQDMENRYYKQFSAMETAMSKMNSQSSSLASMLGGSSS